MLAREVAGAGGILECTAGDTDRDLHVVWVTVTEVGTAVDILDPIRHTLGREHDAVPAVGEAASEFDGFGTHPGHFDGRDGSGTSQRSRKPDSEK